jgi:hypothetical protein
MRIKAKVLVGAICALAVVTSASSVIAQSAQEKAAQDKAAIEKVIVQTVAGAQEGQIRVTAGPGGDNFVFVSTEMSLTEKLVKGAPYSADAVTEMTQVLGDGNRIVNRNTASVARDSEGRTRREQTLRAIGPYASAGEPPKTLFINDPVAGVSYMLDQSTKTARKTVRIISSDQVRTTDAAKAEAMAKKAEAMARAGGAAGSSEKFNVQVAGPGIPGGVPGGVMGGIGERVMLEKQGTKESLGTQTIEGLVCEGTRITRTIAAGEIGNENPINIVSEKWYSPDLQTVVLDKHSDPRFGETVFRLTNINRNEPAKSLFEVPADYTVKENIAPMRYQLERKAQRQDN